MSDAAYSKAHRASACVPAGEMPAKIRQAPPCVAEAKKRLAAAAGRPQPWLTPAALAALSDAPEVIGPATYQGVPEK